MLRINELSVQYVIDASGEKSAVIVPIAQFRQLVADLNDLAIIAERVDEPAITHEQLLDELKADGLLSD